MVGNILALGFSITDLSLPPIFNHIGQKWCSIMWGIAKVCNSGSGSFFKAF